MTRWLPLIRDVLVGLALAAILISAAIVWYWAVWGDLDNKHLGDPARTTRTTDG